MRTTLRMAALAAVVGIGWQALVADAGWRHFRFFGAGCSAPSCSGPLYVAAPPPVCACCAPVLTCGIPACGAPSCFQPAWYGAPMGYGGAPMMGGYPPAWGQGYGSTYGVGGPAGYGAFGPAYPQAAPYGAPGLYGTPAPYGSPGQPYGTPALSFGTPAQPPYGGIGAGPGGFGAPGIGYGIGYGIGTSVPSYYAPVAAQYAPVPPVPASDLVW